MFQTLDVRGNKMLAILKVLIIEKYQTQARFSAACGKGENWISRIIHKRDIPSKEDISLICRKLTIKNPKDYF